MSGSPFAISPALRPASARRLNLPAPPPPAFLAGRISLNQNVTKPWSFEEDLVAYEAAGVSTVGLTIEKIDECGRERAVEMFHQSRLQASSLNWIAGLTGANGYSLDDAIDDGVETLRLAHQLDAKTVVVITGPRNNHLCKHLRRMMKGTLRELSDYAERLDVNLALMPMGKAFEARWSYLTSLRDACDLICDVDRKNTGLVVNTAHVFKERGLPAVLAEAAPLTKLVRLADCGGSPAHANDQRWIGDGIVPVAGIAASLDLHGYEGYYEVDVWSRDLWEGGRLTTLVPSISDLSFLAPSPPAHK